jgi:hypothetical protein
MNDSSLGNSVGEIIEDLIEKQSSPNMSKKFNKILIHNPFRNLKSPSVAINLAESKEALERQSVQTSNSSFNNYLKAADLQYSSLNTATD